MMRQRVAHAPREPLFGSTTVEATAIPESLYRLDLHPAYLNLLARMEELEPPDIGGVPYFRFHQGLVRDTTRLGEPYSRRRAAHPPRARRGARRASWYPSESCLCQWARD